MTILVFFWTAKLYLQFTVTVRRFVHMSICRSVANTSYVSSSYVKGNLFCVSFPPLFSRYLVVRHANMSHILCLLFCFSLCLYFFSVCLYLLFYGQFVLVYLGAAWRYFPRESELPLCGQLSRHSVPGTIYEVLKYLRSAPVLRGLLVFT